MTVSRGEDEFLFKAIENGAVASQIRADDFERDHAAEFHVAGFVDGAHATLTELAQNFIALGQQVAGHQGRLPAGGETSGT